MLINVIMSEQEWFVDKRLLVCMYDICVYISYYKRSRKFVMKQLSAGAIIHN